MARRFVRVDLSDNARDFRPVAVEPGVAVLDRSGAHAKMLFKWLGGLVGELEWEADSVNFYVRDDHGGRLEDAVCQPASDEDLQGPLRSDLDLLRDRLAKARPETPAERALLKTICESFTTAIDDQHLPDCDCFFFRYKDVQNRWRLVWCPGYQRADREPARVVICTNPECNLLFVRRQGTNPKCPGCEAMPAVRPAARPHAKRRWWAAALVLLLAAVAALWWWQSGRLKVTPDQLDLFVGQLADFQVERSPDEPIEMHSSDPAVLGESPGPRFFGTGEGKAWIDIRQGRKKGRVEVNVRGGGVRSIAARPEAVEVPVGGETSLKVTAQTDEGREFEVFPAVLAASKRPDPEFAEFDSASLTLRGRKPTEAARPQELVLAYQDLQATVPVRVSGGATIAVSPPQPKAVKVVIVSDQGDSVQLPVGAEFNDFRVEAQYPDGFTRVVTKKATLRAADEPAKAPVSFADGRIVGVRPGRTTVYAEFDGIATKEGLKTEVTAGAHPDEIRLAPSPLNMAPGETIPMEAIGYKGGKSIGTINHLPGLAWKPSDESTVRIDGSAVTALKTGTSGVTAQLGSVTSKPAEVRVVDKIADRLRIEPDAIRLRVGESCRIGPDVTVTRGNADVSRSSDATPLDPQVVRYDPQAHALIGLAPGVSPVTFALGGQTAAALVEVVPAGSVQEGGVVVEPAGGTLSPGQAINLRVYLVTKQGDRIDRTTAATFASSDAEKVSISQDWACALAPGTAEITARLPEAKSPGRAHLTVDDHPITELIVEPPRLEMAVGDRARLNILGRSASGTHELFPQENLKITRSGPNPEAVKVVGSQHVDALATGTADLQVSWADKFRRQVRVQVGNEGWTGLEIDPARATIHPGQRLAYLVTGVRGGRRRVIGLQDGLKLSIGDPGVGQVVDGTSVRGEAPGRTTVTARVGQEKAEARLRVTAGSGPEGVVVESANPGVYVSGAGGEVYRAGPGGAVPSIVEPVPRYVPLPPSSLAPAESTPRFQDVKAGISDQIVPDFSLNLTVTAAATRQPLEYRAYAAGQTPADAWVKAEPQGDRQRAVLESPRIKTRPLSTWYDLILEARNPADGTIQQHPLRFRLPQRITIDAPKE